MKTMFSAFYRQNTLSGLMFAWTKFRESASFLPYFSIFQENHDFKYFAWTKFREIAKINPLKVRLLNLVPGSRLSNVLSQNL